MYALPISSAEAAEGSPCPPATLKKSTVRPHRHSLPQQMEREKRSGSTKGSGAQLSLVSL